MVSRARITEKPKMTIERSIPYNTTMNTPVPFTKPLCSDAGLLKKTRKIPTRLRREMNMREGVEACPNTLRTGTVLGKT